MSVGIWRRSYNQQLTSKLTEKGEARTNWTDFARKISETQRYIVVSQKVLQECQLNVFGDFDMFNLDSPLEGQIKVHKEDIESISDPVCCASILGSHSSQQDVEMIMPAKLIMYMPRRELTLSSSQAPRGLQIRPKPGQQTGYIVDNGCLCLPAAVSQTALKSRGIPPSMLKFVYKRTAQISPGIKCKD